MYERGALDRLYDFVVGDEDARVCKDIPEESCDDQPRNFFVYLAANVLGKVADELASARLILPWLLGELGAPAVFAGFLVPIREAGVLLPQLAVAATIRRVAVRKWVWIVGALLAALSLVAMSATSLSLQGVGAGWAVVLALVLFSLARGVCSVSAKDVLGKTVSKSRRGNLMGLAAGIAGVLTLTVGLYVEIYAGRAAPAAVISSLFLVGTALWLLAAAAFAGIREQPGATEGGGSALSTALESLDILRTDRDFRRFLSVRILLLGIALVPPFYVLLAQQRSGGLSGLGMLIIASGLAGSLSAPFWGRFGDRSSRMVMTTAAAAGGLLGVLVWLLVALDAPLLDSELSFAVLFLLAAVCHSGVRLGRKIYLVDMATLETRATYVALSNTVIGVAMLAGGIIGALGDLLDASAVILILSLLSLAAALRARRLPEVSAADL